MYDPSKDTADNERLFSDLYAGKQDFRPGRGQPGAGLRYPYQKPETPRIGPLFLEKPAILLQSFLQLFYFISVLPTVGRGRGEGRPLIGCVSAAGCINSGKFTTE